ncbi:hypothetical protein FH972_015508 [Carpinus fangiana]|uniref:J domain-containing protein n=1 Tax=Carpinus fangiana TaxID=176857 RepID=A0A5N6REW1_9ROSI|nr:hypothetical protein FH972_015508 [Carpinus fangiana]
MDCNKEEAIRAKRIAEEKMESKDFSGARKIALKAQQLYPDVENVSQMLTVCDVHCSADQRLFANEMDWYAILQIEQTANEAMIKKQYRKLALQLHPDKNKFSGAEAAFKLIGEAQRVLLDRDRRSLHDMKRRAPLSRPAAQFRPPQKPIWNSNVGVQNDFRNKVTGLNPQQQQWQQPAQAGHSDVRPTFWTVCPFCSVRYQYYREVVNRSLRCQSCNKPFIAYDMNVHGAPPTTKMSQSAFPLQKDDACKVEVGCQGNLGAQSSKTEKKGRTSKVGSEKVNSKRGRKQVVESSESCDSDSSSESEEDVVGEDGNLQDGQNFECYRDQNRRRSMRHKQQVSYKENLSDDDDTMSNRKRAKGSGSSADTGVENGDASKEASKSNNLSDLAADVKHDLKEVKQNGNACSGESLLNGNMETKKVSGKETANEDNHKKSSEAHEDSKSKLTPDPEYFQYPDPDFSDFENGRREVCFAGGQIWAVYDTLDAMPRFYARIRKVLSPGFKLRITWLEPDPADENEIKWVSEDLPTSCGKYKNGSSEEAEDRLMFSHLIAWEKGSRRDTFNIYPRRGETWALFKNWDIKWYSEPDQHRKYEYEFVEILLEYKQDAGISVAYLGKVKGFASLFCRMVKDERGTFQVPPAELFRFSHRVPSFKMTGEERRGVPVGSFELDPASLPLNLEEIAVPGDLEVEDGNMHHNGSTSIPSEEVRPAMKSDGNASMSQANVKRSHLEHGDSSYCNVNEDYSNPPASSPEAIEIPEPEFYNFDAEKSEEKFRVGQIWALYSDEDGLPKYYGQIKKIDSSPCFKLQISWLMSCSLPNHTIRWHDGGMPICCGRFKIKRGETQAYTSTSSFSHQIRTDPAGKKNEYAIFPRKGEVWAMYRNWSVGIKCSDLENCEYDIVEVVEEDDLLIGVFVLEQVDGFNSVFKAQIKEGSEVTIGIPQVELLKFSHKIPAFRLTEERDGSLRGFWEVDPAALPVHYFSLN